MPTYFTSTPPPFIAADFHYFRLPREKWILMLTRLAQIGATMVSASVPWGFHEFEQGTIDLTGNTNPRRDLVGLLDICTALKLHVLLKLDPQHNGINILNEGLPHWLLSDEPNFDSILADAFNGWIQAVGKSLTPYQWPDGPLAALRIERTMDQQPVYSQELTEVRWPIWLRKRYKGIDALNEAYQSDYRSVSNVPFPQRWSETPTQLEQDAREFLAEVDADTRSKLDQSLLDAGWQIPIYPVVLEEQPDLPKIQSVSLTTLDGLTAENAILTLQAPIQLDPDPTDVGRGPSWADNAPIRSDGSVRRNFWAIRHQIWEQIWDDVTPTNGLLTRQFEDGGLVSAERDVDIKISVPKDTKPTAYRLALDGKVTVADNLKIARNKLSGSYLLETGDDQTDFVFTLNDPAAPLTEFLLSHLQQLLQAQQQRLSRCAAQAATLQPTLEPPPARAAKKQAPAKPTSYTIAEARRGLSEADRILRKAISSIGGLEAGFDIMLDRGSNELPHPAEPSAAISPEIFEGRARDILIAAGQACAEIVPTLKSAAQTVQKSIDNPDEFTIERYQQSHDTALDAAKTARETLLQTIADLRLEMASETLPLVAWRVHNQIVEIVESLRLL